MKIIKGLRGKFPQFGKNIFLAENVTILGDVFIDDEASIWYNVVLRGDVAPLKIGKQANIQDGAVLHGTYEKCGVTIGDRVTVGHLAMLHGCQIGKACLIGMSSLIMDKTEIGDHSIVGAGSLVKENSIFPPRSLILGRPAKVVRELTSEEIEKLEHSADNYLLYKSWYE